MCEWNICEINVEPVSYIPVSGVNGMPSAAISGDDLRERLRSFRAAALGLSFLPEGLEVKLTIGNPNVSDADERFSFDDSSGSSSASSNRLLWIVAGVVVLGFVFLMMRRRKE